MGLHENEDEDEAWGKSAGRTAMSM
jgi:hypothetical protein